MIDFYALTSPTVQRVFIMLEEVGLAYNLKPVDVWAGQQYDAKFLELNPNAKIPVIVDHDGPGGRAYTVFESGAILLYLADKTGKFLPTDMASRYEAIQWLMLVLTGVGPMFGQFTHFKSFAPKDAGDYALRRYQSEVLRLYDVLEKRLGQRGYLGGDQYSVADMAAFPWTRNYATQGVKLEDRPNLSRWFNAVSERPAVKRMIQQVNAIKSTRDSASEDDKDRFFGRGRYARA